MSMIICPLYLENLSPSATILFSRDALILFDLIFYPSDEAFLCDINIRQNGVSQAMFRAC